MILYIILSNSFYPKNDCLDISATEVLNKLNIPKLNFEKVQLCERTITKDEVLETLKSMKNNKSPGNDGFPKEFYEIFWNSLAEPFLNSIKTGKLKNELTSSQR